MRGGHRPISPRLVVAVAVAMALVTSLLFVRLVTNRVEELSEVPSGVSLPAPAEGQRWVTYRNASVLVPTTWESMNGPGFFDCLGRWAGDEPLVITPRREPRSAGHCAVTIREPDVPSPYVRFSDQPEEPFTPEGHHAIQQVGEAWVTVVWFRRSQLAAVQAVMQSARTTDLDAGGCPVRGAEVAPPSNWDGSVETLTACQYDPRLSGSNLYSSALLVGAQAEETWRELRHAPRIPTLAQGNCDASSAVTEPVPLRVVVRDREGASHWVVVALDDCGGIGVDLGDRLVALSAAACQPLMPVRPITAFPAQRCTE